MDKKDKSQVNRPPTKKQHYVPSYYLGGFADKESRKVEVKDKNENKEWEERKPAKIFYREYMYEMDIVKAFKESDAALKDMAELIFFMLEEYESVVASIKLKPGDSDELLRQNRLKYASSFWWEFIDLAYKYSMPINMVESLLCDIENEWKDKTKKKFKDVINGPDKLDEEMFKWLIVQRERTVAMLSSQLEGIPKDNRCILDSSDSLSEALRITALASYIEDPFQDLNLEELKRALEYNVIRVDGKFITSDNPVFSLVHDGGGFKRKRFMFSAESSHVIVFPVDYFMCVVLSHDYTCAREALHCPPEVDLEAHINFLIAENAQEQIVRRPGHDFEATFK